MDWTGLIKKDIISYFLLSVIVSFIDTYIYPGMAARFLSLPNPATVFVVALLLFTGSIVLQKLIDWLSSSSLSWPEVKTIKIEKLVSLYILVVILFYLVLQNPNYFNIGPHVFGAFSLVIYLVMKNKLPILAKDKVFEVALLVIIPAIVVQMITGLYMELVMNVPSSTSMYEASTTLFAVYILAWGISNGLVIGLVFVIFLRIIYYGVTGLPPD